MPDTAPDILASPGLAEFMHNQQRLGVLQTGGSCCALEASEVLLRTEWALSLLRRFK